MVLSLLLLNLVFNIFLWIWEILNSKLLSKTQMILKILIGKGSKYEQKVDGQQKDLQSLDSAENR